jgi:hypothetical protein
MTTDIGASFLQVTIGRGVTRRRGSRVDRVTFNAHILETGTQSYRLHTSKTTARRKRAS